MLACGRAGGGRGGTRGDEDGPPSAGAGCAILAQGDIGMPGGTAGSGLGMPVLTVILQRSCIWGVADGDTTGRRPVSRRGGRGGPVTDGRREGAACCVDTGGGRRLIATK